MVVWVIWLIITMALGVAEIFTLTTALGLLGGAARPGPRPSYAEGASCAPPTGVAQCLAV
jgi:hypothetical protein